MHQQYRSPTRKPVDTARTINYSQPQRKPIAAMPPTQQVEQGMGEMRIDDYDETDDFGFIGASAERSPGRISGRNRETAMFDPMGKRATYLPYGGFDSIIDEYYTEGDPTGIAIPAPSQLQRREQSQSPQRVANMSRSPVKEGSLHDRRDSANRVRPDLPRQHSGASAHSSKAGSMHSTSPTRAQHPQVYDGREDAVFKSGPNLATPQYYDDEPYYATEPVQARSAPYPDDMAVRNRPRTDNYDGGAYSDRRMPQSNGSEMQQRGRYDGSNANAAPLNGPPRTQRGPPLRGQRSMEFSNGGRQPGPGAYGNVPPMDPRRRDPRAMQQDPRLAPRPMQDARSRQGPPQRQQQMRPGQDQYDREDRMNGRGGQQMSYDDRVADPRMRQQQRPQRDLRNETGGAYPPAQTNPQRRPMQQGMVEPPIGRHGSPPIPRPQDMRMQPEQRRPSPSLARDERVPSPVPAPGASMQQRGAAPNGAQRPPQQSQSQQRPPAPPATQQPQAQSQANPNRRSETSDMAMQPEPSRPVTLQEIQSLRKDVAKNSSPQLQLTLVKRLMEASVVLASEGGKADAKVTKKNRDDYNREALRTLKQITAQEKPFPEAVFFLANCYGNGSLSLDVDHERAFGLYEQAAKLQHPASAYRTAVCLEIGAGTRQDVERAVRFYRRAAEYGDAAAMYKIGMILLRGLLQERVDARQALIWLQKAAEKADIDNPHALHELALLYERGDAGAGIPLDEAHAKDLFTRAAKLHYAPSQYRLGYAYEYGTLGCPVDPRRSIAWFSRGAERGDPESELSLSGWYLTGSDGILAQNDREAYLWGRKAAEKGLAKAEFAVGYFFESGIGTNVDLDEAVKWYKRAATAGQKKAQERLLALGKRKR